MESFSIALTGHRPQRLDGYDLTRVFYKRLGERLDQVIEEALIDHEQLMLHSGLALGADSLWSHRILNAKAIHRDRIRFVAHVPFPGQPDVWPRASDRTFWKHQTQFADQVITYGLNYSPALLHERNQGMVNTCDLLVAVYDGSPHGGTANAVQYAISRGKNVLNLHPDQFRNN